MFIICGRKVGTIIHQSSASTICHYGKAGRIEKEGRIAKEGRKEGRKNIRTEGLYRKESRKGGRT